MATYEVNNSKMTRLCVKLCFLMYSEECLLSTLSWNAHLFNNKILGKLDRTRLDSVPANCIVLVLNAAVLVNRLLVTVYYLEPFKLRKELQRLRVLELNINPEFSSRCLTVSKVVQVLRNL
jgi:hypothetical protein